MCTDSQLSGTLADSHKPAMPVGATDNYASAVILLRVEGKQGARAGAVQRRQRLARAKRRSRSAGALCARSAPPQGSAMSAEYTRKSV